MTLNIDEKAIHFIQAEKIYYESALIDTTDIQKKLGMVFFYKDMVLEQKNGTFLEPKD